MADRWTNFGAAMSLVRFCKIALVAAIALFFTLVAFGNVTDYGSNWAFVQHVLSMDTIFVDSDLHWRAVTDPTLQTIVYWLIIATQALVAILLWAGVFRLLVALRAERFDEAKSVAIAGLVLGFLLYAVGFVVIGGEWFAMWQSHTWNGQSKAFEFITMISAVLIILLLPDPPRGGAGSA
jgi:predicted small integral membrane protein